MHTIFYAIQIVFWLQLIRADYDNVIDYNFTKILTSNEKNSFFGYSLLLQQGKPSYVYVGAPRASHFGKTNGGIFRCNLQSLQCNKFENIAPQGFSVNFDNSNGAFLGAIIEGDNITDSNFFYTCAPQRIVATDDYNYYFTKGYCFKVNLFGNQAYTEENIAPLKKFPNINYNSEFSYAYYDAGYGQAGFDFKYIKEQNSVIYGAPGKANGAGALVHNFNKYNDFTLYNNVQGKNTEIYYLGYAVAFGKFLANSNQIWYVAGAPRQNNFQGKVIFLSDTSTKINELFGDDFGSYFGSSLLVVPQTGGDDIIVGAPNSAEDTYDVGCIYYYKNVNFGSFATPLKVCGQPASKFGTAMTYLGDINLDGFKDVAISAPYEDDGRGAVYLYFKLEKSEVGYHRLTPANFEVFMPNTVIEGFGLGLSKGVDINHNKHNSFIVGAFRSSQIFQINTRVMVDYEANLSFNIDVLFRSSTSFTTTYCIKSVWRNGIDSQIILELHLNLNDERISSAKTQVREALLRHSIAQCWNNTFLIKGGLQRMEPFSVSLGYKNPDSNNVETLVTKTLSISRNCRENQACFIDLKIKAFPNELRVIRGLNNELEVHVCIENTIKSAYEMQIELLITTEATLIKNGHKCIPKNNCTLTYFLPSGHQLNQTLVFDLRALPHTSRNISVGFYVYSVESDKDAVPGNNYAIVDVPISVVNSPLVFSEADPNAVKVGGLVLQPMTFLQKYIFANDGPSPVRFNVTFLVPSLNYEKNPPFVFEGFSNKNGIDCPARNRTIGVRNATGIDSNDISCTNPAVNCTEYYCQGDYLSKSSQPIAFSLKFSARLDYLVEMFGDGRKVAFASIAIFGNDTHQIRSSSVTVFNSPTSKTVPIWIYAIAIICGSLLLAALTAGLYRCQFFQRPYRHKLMDDQSDSIELQSTETTENSSL